MRRLIPIVAVAMLTLAAAPPKVGDMAPSVSFKDLTGQKLDLKSYRGKVVLVDFWATWCGPCKEEIPHFIELQNKYGADGLVVIGISMDESDKPVRAYAPKMGMNYPIVMGDAKLGDRFGGILGLPVTFLIDREGRLAARHDGQTAAAVFEKEVVALLGK